MKKILIFSFIITLVTSCIGPEPEDVVFHSADFLENLSGVDVDVISYTSSFATNALDTISILNGESREVYLWGCDSIKVLFDTKKTIMYTALDTTKSPLNHKDYIQITIYPDTIKYIYTITEQDYLDADSIK